jgi:hypothetical protein
VGFGSQFDEPAPFLQGHDGRAVIALFLGCGLDPAGVGVELVDEIV